MLKQTRTSHPEYFVWRSMRERCRKWNLLLESSWDEDFFNFLANMGPRPSKKYSLDRLNPEKGYVKGNCRWATAQQQSQNRKIKGGPKRKKTRSSSFDPTTGQKRPSVASTAEYKCWMEMRQRCQNPKRINYCDYGAKGIEVCPEWEDFWKFREDVGLRPSKQHSLDRIDPLGNYEPGNVRWATRREQANNRKYHTRFEWNGELLTASKWEERTGIPGHTIYERIVRYKWTVEKALTTLPLTEERDQENDWSLGTRISSKGRKSLILECRGKSLTLSEWGEKLNLNPETIRKRLKAGMTPEEALFKQSGKHGVKRKNIKEGRSHPIATFKGETKSLVQWAKQYRIGLATLHNRLRNGWDIERALITRPLR